ncbi:hypothetical protein [Streptomyces sp. NPDC001068]|uniref:hypothetical protein n=1 Tax=Streptomyces sp. NPDC001068 TaxID=3364544 RepID=UPI0036B08B2D
MIVNWARHAVRRALRVNVVVAGLCALVLGSGLVSPAPAAAGVPSIDGSYAFDGNGWKGTLSVSGAASGSPSVTMRYDELGRSEYLTGTWSPGSGTLSVVRPLPWGNSQTYTLFLGDHIASSPVFGGYFTQSDIPGMRYGAYADAYVRPGLARPAAKAASRAAEAAGTRATVVQRRTAAAASLPTGILGAYDFNGNGWQGRLLLQFAECLNPDTQMYYYERGFWEGIANRTWDASTGTLTLVRPLSGGVTQTYTLYIGTHRADDPMFGGYFTESDVPGRQFAAFADRSPGGVGC